MKTIGQKRTFENYPNIEYTIENIYYPSIIYTLRLDKLKCSNCGEYVFKERNYTFKYIEKLKDKNNNIKYLGVSTDEKYVLLDDYIDKKEIEKNLGI